MQPHVMLRAAKLGQREQVRPRLFSCPWCGDAGAPFDVRLPPALRLCDECADADLSVRMCPQPPPEWHRGFGAWEISHGYQPPAPDPREEHRATLRAGLLAALREFGTRWPGCEFGKGAVGTMFLAALGAAGADPAAELLVALATLTPAEYGRLRCYVGGLPEVQGGEWPAAPAKPTRKARTLRRTNKA